MLTYVMLTVYAIITCFNIIRSIGIVFNKDFLVLNRL